MNVQSVLTGAIISCSSGIICLPSHRTENAIFLYLQEKNVRISEEFYLMALILCIEIWSDYYE